MLSFDPNSKRSFMLDVANTVLKIPVTVICGIEQSKTITLSAGVHSREYIGIEALIQLARQLRCADVNGQIIILHSVNYSGFVERSNDLVPEDNRNLNRVFPGKSDGRTSERLAYFLEHEIIARSDYIVDLHSGGVFEELMPHSYFTIASDENTNNMSKKLASLLDVNYIVESTAKNGFYSYACQCKVPSIIIERGGYGIMDKNLVDMNIYDLKNILRYLNVLNDKVSYVQHNAAIIKKAVYENSIHDGCWYPCKKVGDFIYKDEKIGEIRDIFGNLIEEVYSKLNAVILYQTMSLAISKGSPMIAYGEIERIR